MFLCDTHMVVTPNTKYNQHQYLPIGSIFLIYKKMSPLDTLKIQIEDCESLF